MLDVTYNADTRFHMEEDNVTESALQLKMLEQHLV
jgi:hypothetical protein